MNGKKFNISVVFFIIVVFGLIASVYFYNKPHLDVENTKADYVLTAQNLIDEYQKNETVTNEKYSESIVQVSGKIMEISTLKGNGVITINDGSLKTSIICHMLTSQNAQTISLKKGQEVVIKGICTGYLLDVIMVKCTLVE